MNEEDKNGTIPTAIAFIGFIAVAVLCFFMIREKVNESREQKDITEQSEVGQLSDLRVVIDGKEYFAKTESTKAAKSFLKSLPLSIEMSDSSENEKKGYTYFKMTTDAKKLGKVEIGDILLSGDSYVVVATKTFKTSNKYTKIAHIHNLGEVRKGVIQTYISISSDNE